MSLYAKLKSYTLSKVFKKILKHLGLDLHLSLSYWPSVILISRTQVFQIEQSGIEVNWITGAPYAWLLSLTHIFLSTANMVATMFDMVVVDIARKMERHC